MSANIHVVLDWICDDSKPEKAADYLVEYEDGSHDVRYWSSRHHDWEYRDPAVFSRTGGVVAWARIPSVKGS